MPWSAAAAVVGAYVGAYTKEDKMKSWRIINNNMIQTYNKHVWLWDNKEGVAVLAPVPSRPWKKLDEDFTHWMVGMEGEENPGYPPQDDDVYVAKEQLEEMINTTLFTSPF